MRRILMAVVALIMAMGGMLFVSPSATAVEGCPGSVVLKGSPWAYDLAYDDMFWHIGAVEQYWFCPNGSGADKMMAIKTAYCITKSGGDYSDPWMTGFKFNAYISNSNQVTTDPNEFIFPWDNGTGSGGVQRCLVHDHINSPWMYIGTDPYWKLNGWQTFNMFPDLHFEFMAGGDNRRQFDLHGDPIIDPFGKVTFNVQPRQWHTTHGVF
jgi:hypothetical protein